MNLDEILDLGRLLHVISEFKSEISWRICEKNPLSRTNKETPAGAANMCNFRGKAGGKDHLGT